jgi:hypothetical protein
VGKDTATVAVPDLEVSASLVAVTLAVPAVDGAEKMPPALMEPREVFQVTPLSVVVPATVAVKSTVAPVVTDFELGVTVTEFTTGEGAETVTVDVPDFVVSATLVAVTVSLSAVAVAVYKPADVIAPWVAFQITDLFVTVPATVAAN